MDEVVLLPDPARQPLLHPMDVPAARRPFVAAWLLALGGHPLATLSLGIMVWAAGDKPLIALVATAVWLVATHTAGRYFSDESWAFIPRKRQALERPLPVRWELAGGLVHAALLGGAIVLSLRWFDQRAFPAGVLVFIAGAGIGLSLLLTADFIRRVASLARGSGAGPALVRGLPSGLVAIVASLYVTWLARAEPVSGDWATTGLLMGAATLLGAQAVYWTAQAAQSRRPTGSPGDHGPGVGAAAQ